LAKRPAEASEVFCENHDVPAIDRSPAGDDRIAERTLVFDSKTLALVPDEGVDFLERTLVDQKLDALARRQLASVVLTIDGPLIVSLLRLCAQTSEFLNLVFCGHRSSGIGRGRQGGDG
jgi:hypothetical protein